MFDFCIPNIRITLIFCTPYRFLVGNRHTVNIQMMVSYSSCSCFSFIMIEQKQPVFSNLNIVTFLLGRFKKIS